MAKATNYRFVMDPMKFARICWPKVTFYKQQQEIIYSVANNDETYVPAGNKLGKDFVAGFIVLWFFMTRRPCRIVTTSAKEDHLRVLWGEINNYIDSAAVPMRVADGGPLIVNYHELKWEYEGKRCPLSYATGMVASDASIAAMQGHHVANVGDGIPRTLFVCDESSSVANEYMTMASTWMDRALVLGNTWPCENFFKWAVKGKPGTDDMGGDIPRPVKAGEAPGNRGYWRKVFRIKAEDSPNVRLALEEQARGLEPSGRIVVPGVKSWEEYQKNRRMWDAHQQCVSLDADWYEGSDVKLFPKDWLDRAYNLYRERVAESNRLFLENVELEKKWQALNAQYRKAKPKEAGQYWSQMQMISENIELNKQAIERAKKTRVGKGIGVDPAEGGDNTAITCVDEDGVLELKTKKTPDTDVIAGEIIAMMTKWQVPANRVCIDRGGGGKQIADRLRKVLIGSQFGSRIRTVAFGEGVTMEPHRGTTSLEQRIEVAEERYTYVNRRAQMYGELSMLSNFAIPPQYPQFRSQLAPIPKTRDGEGRLYLLPKGKKRPDSKEPTLTELIGHSPDEADSLVLAVHAMLHKDSRKMAGAL